MEKDIYLHNLIPKPKQLRVLIKKTKENLPIKMKKI